jgi:hypothetical protein
MAAMPCDDAAVIGETPHRRGFSVPGADARLPANDNI